MRPFFCCYICTCICCLKLHQVGEVFFNSIWLGATQLQCIYYLCRILISRPPRVFRRFKRRSCEALVLHTQGFLWLYVDIYLHVSCPSVFLYVHSSGFAYPRFPLVICRYITSCFMSFSVSLRAQGDLKFSNICHDCVTGIWANSVCEVTLKDMGKSTGATPNKV